MTARFLNSLVPLFAFLCVFFSQTESSLAAQAADSVKLIDEERKNDIRRQVAGDITSNLEPEYRIGYRDILSVSVYGEGSMAVGDPQSPAQDADDKSKSSGEQIRGRGQGVEVRLDGRISLLHLGDVPVVGMSISQLAEYLQKLYKSIYDAPLVTVTLKQSNSRRYTIMGQVKTPGLYHLDFPLTVVEAVARAGGFTQWAKEDITVIRPQRTAQKAKSDKAGKQEGQSFKFNYSTFLKGENVDSNIFLQSDDIVVIH